MKIKKLAAGLLAMTFVFGGAVLPNAVAGNVVVTANAEEADVFGGFKYTILEDGTAEITAYNGDAKVEIPDEIDDKAVTSIGRYAFSNKSIVSISMPDSITTIRWGAFANCGAIADVKLSANLRTIEGYVFYNCGNIESIEMPESVTSIGEHAFYGCKSIKELTLFPNITNDIGYMAFANTNPSLTFNCYNGSKAEKYALNNGISFKILDVEDKTEFPVLREVQFNSDFRQIRLKWTEVEAAEKYGIAVFLAGKWRIQTQDISADITTYTTPKNITRNKDYKIAIAAKVNGKWERDKAINNAFSIHTPLTF